jgi:putative ABC transport system permease protein
MAQQTIEQAEQGLKFAYALILSLAAIMIFNTFLMNVSERRRQLAILRAIGTVRMQVIWLLLREGLFMGVVGTVVGSVLGVGGAILLTSVVSKGYASTMPTVQITIWPFVLAAIIGPGMSLSAMLIPAWLAGRISAMEGIRPAVAKEGARVPLSFALSGVATFIITGSALAACVTGWLPVAWTTWMGTVFTAAFVMLVPAVLGPLTRFAAFLLRPLLGLEGRLAQRQVLRRRTRTTLTIGVLYIAISSGIALGTTLINSVDDLRGWLNDTFQGDFLIRDPSGDLSSARAIPIPESLGADLRAIPGVENVDGIRSIDSRVNDMPVKVVVREYARQANLPLHLQEGRPDEVRRQMIDGDVVVGSVLANRTGTALGQTISMDTSEGTKRFRVAGITTEYIVGGLIVHMERAAGKRLLGVEGVNLFVIKADIHAISEVRTRLRALCEKNDLQLQSFADLRLRTDAIANGIIGSLWGLLGLGFVVAAFGIANTLTMNVLEQTRELAMLRVVAMTRAQVRKTILAQATIIGVIGLVTGSIGGIVGAYITSLCSKAVMGQAVNFSLHMGLVALSAIAAMVIILVAAWIPSERAARLNLLLALKYE